MGRKIKLSHTEVELKIFLEVLAVYGVLALVLIGAYYLEPAITGFVTVTKQFNYTDKVNLEFSESGEYVWNLANPGNLKSVRIEGSKSKQGEAKVYIEDNGIRYLIFDSSRLVEKPSGMFGITGFVIVEDKEKDKIKTKIEGVLNNEQQIILDLLVLNINKTRNNIEIELEVDDGKVSKEIKGIATELQNELINNLSLSLENSTEKIKIRIEAEFEEPEETKIPINETPIINETIENEIINKIIDINLEYGDNEVYDADNDGIESLTGVIDFSVKDSDFNWDADERKLCTRYEIFSVENQESVFACFGNNDCCSFVGLGSSRDLWNDDLFLSYGGYGSTENNIVFAQVIYADYNLDIAEPYSDIAYSSWDNKTAKFSADIIEFEGICIDTCLFSGNASSYKLIVELEDTKLWIDEIGYLVEERATNFDPILVKNIENISLMENKYYSLDLSEYFSDEDNDALAYSYSEIDNITIRLEGNFAYIIPDEGFTGIRFAFITASDGYGQTVSNVFKIDVMSGRLSIELLDSTIEDNIWSVGFGTNGIGNLTISAVSGSTYSEMNNDNVSTINNLDALSLRCDDFEIFDKDKLIETNDLWFVLMNNSKVKLIELIGKSLMVKGIYAENYNCNGIGHFTARVLREGESIQEFKFGNETKITGIEHAERALRETFEIRDAEGNRLMALDSFGNVNIKGNLTENAFIEADENDFVIENANGINLAVKNPEGNMLISSYLNENQSILLPTSNSFVIQNKNSEIVAYVNSTGSLFLRGFLTENALFE